MTQTYPPTLDDILILEKQVWQALIDGDPVADGAMLTSDFLGVYPSGFSNKVGHTGQLDQGPTMAEYRLSQARLVPLGEGRVLLAYHAAYRAVDAVKWDAMYISSIWEHRDNEWLNSFSQDTPAA
ncbi:protein of unknown function [Shimia gijangensis]|uniref:DUF4440 domain-containing protein n=1 Tax=Shimia gijangensis TaxID=1470563 RepID=A0A1M6N5Y2_9RHOB|nr:nuclear transport factor 2 family protein [Shimia gijangensis]SHJ91129.1 protein of unknown function [Shimia gijangensis]